MVAVVVDDRQITALVDLEAATGAGEAPERRACVAPREAGKLQRRARPGDVLLVVGAGDVDRAVGLLGG